MKFLYTILIFLLIAACDSPEPSPVFRDSVEKALQQTETIKSDSFPEVNLDTVDCNDLNNPAVVYALAKDAQENGFPMFDKLDYFTVNGHFTSENATEILIFIDAYAGGSCGSCCNLLLILSCESKLNVVWSGNCGTFSKSDVRDLNSDGIDEIVMNCGSTWSGELNEWFHIVNYKSGKENIVFEKQSSNYIYGSYGTEDWKKYQFGDTIHTYYRDSVSDADPNGNFSVIQIREREIYCGGKTEGEIDKRKKTVCDTVIIPLTNETRK